MQYDDICDKIRYLISEKSGITDINHSFGRIRIDSYKYLPFEKTLTFHVIILIELINNKNENYYYNIFGKRFV